MLCSLLSYADSDVGGGTMPADIEAEIENAMNTEPPPVMARKVGEVLQTTLGVLGTAVPTTQPVSESGTPVVLFEIRARCIKCAIIWNFYGLLGSDWL